MGLGLGLESGSGSGWGLGVPARADERGVAVLGAEQLLDHHVARRERVTKEGRLAPRRELDRVPAFADWGLGQGLGEGLGKEWIRVGVRVRAMASRRVGSSTVYREGSSAPTKARRALRLSDAATTRRTP